MAYRFSSCLGVLCDVVVVSFQVLPRDDGNGVQVSLCIHSQILAQACPVASRRLPGLLHANTYRGAVAGLCGQRRSDVLW